MSEKYSLSVKSELGPKSITLCIKYAEIYLSGFPYFAEASNIEREEIQGFCIERFYCGKKQIKMQLKAGSRPCDWEPLLLKYYRNLLFSFLKIFVARVPNATVLLLSL